MKNNENYYAGADDAFSHLKPEKPNNKDYMRGYNWALKILEKFKKR